MISYKDEVKLDKCLAVELNGAKTYRSLNDPHIVLFYMKAKEETRKERMEKRGDEEVIDSFYRNRNSCNPRDYGSFFIR